MQATQSPPKTQRWQPDDYTTPFRPDPDRLGYCYKLPENWRELLPADCILWFTDDGTSLFVTTIEDEDEDDYPVWTGVTCPRLPTAVTRTATNQYWERIKSGNLKRRNPMIGDFVVMAENPGFPDLVDWLAGVRSPLGELRVLTAAGRYHPDWQVLRSIPAGEDMSHDFIQWAIGVMLDRQVRWPEFLEFAAKNLYRQMTEGSQALRPHGAAGLAVPMAITLP
jgi:hypothetical protein